MNDLTPAGVAVAFGRWLWIGIGALALITGLIIGGWQLGWWFQAQNATRQAQNTQNGYANQTTLRLSNPVQPYQGGVTTDGGDVVDQMDPNGVYSPSASNGTYVICVNSSGAKYLQYWEGDVMTVAAPAEWDQATHSLKVIGAPTAAIHTAPGK